MRRGLKNITNTSVCTSSEACGGRTIINLDHQIQLQNTIILAKKMRQIDQLLREVIEKVVSP
jgi:hypothetical protein